MKLLAKHSIHASREDCAADVMDTALWIVRILRAEIRRARPASLSLNQVRALGGIESFPDSPLCAVADVLGLTAPSTSHLVDGLVRRGLVDRRSAPNDRRQVQLRVTARGARALERALDHSRKHLAARLAPLSAAERASIGRAMGVLRPLVTPARHSGASAA
jgi:DNA-binding MarR family transcriptional regulator